LMPQVGELETGLVQEIVASSSIRRLATTVCSAESDQDSLRLPDPLEQLLIKNRIREVQEDESRRGQASESTH
jgi:hypothetical protein